MITYLNIALHIILTWTLIAGVWFFLLESRRTTNWSWVDVVLILPLLGIDFVLESLEHIYYK